VSWQDCKAVASILKTIYSVPDVEAAEKALTAFEAKYQDSLPQIDRSWCSLWVNIIPFFGYPAETQEGYLHDQRH
jgi:putative transposase